MTPYDDCGHGTHLAGVIVEVRPARALDLYRKRWWASTGGEAPI
jgi:hypothetical protein